MRPLFAGYNNCQDVAVLPYQAQIITESEKKNHLNVMTFEIKKAVLEGICINLIKKIINIKSFAYERFNELN